MRKVLWFITLPWFMAVYLLTTALEGAYWLLSAPSAAWAIVKEKLGLIP